MVLTHQECERLIDQEFRSGDASAEQTEAMRAHIRECEACARVYERYARAETALFKSTPNSGLSAGQVDRVASRLFAAPAPPRSRRWAWGGTLAAVTAVAVVAVLPAEEDDGLRSRQGSITADAPVGIRALRLRSDPSGVSVTDLGTGGRVRHGDRIAIMYAHRDGFTALTVRRLGPEGAIERLGTAAPLPLDTVDERLTVTTVDATWAKGTHVFEARFVGEELPVIRRVSVEVDLP